MRQCMKFVWLPILDVTYYLLSLETSKVFTKQGYNMMYTVSLLLYSM